MEIAKVNQSVDNIGAIGDQLNAIVDTSSALAKTAEQGTSVADMIKPSSDAHVDDEFSKIMGKRQVTVRPRRKSPWPVVVRRRQPQTCEASSSSPTSTTSPSPCTRGRGEDRVAGGTVLRVCESIALESRL